MAKAGLVVGADGVMVEVHHNPARALSDGKQKSVYSAVQGSIYAYQQFDRHPSLRKSMSIPNVE